MGGQMIDKILKGNSQVGLEHMVFYKIVRMCGYYFWKIIFFVIKNKKKKEKNKKNMFHSMFWKTRITQKAQL